MTAAVGTDSDLGVRKLLDLFGAFVARSAFIFVKRHFAVFPLLIAYRSWRISCKEEGSEC